MTTITTLTNSYFSSDFNDDDLDSDNCGGLSEDEQLLKDLAIPMNITNETSEDTITNPPHREELFDYFQRGTIVQITDFDKKSKLESYYTKVKMDGELVSIIYVNKPCKFNSYNTVDLSLIPPEYTYHKEKKFWQRNGKKSSAPRLESVNSLLETDSHPNCHIRQLHTVCQYLLTIISDEGAFVDRYRTVNNQSNVREEITLYHDELQETYVPRFSVVEKVEVSNSRENRDELAERIKAIARIMLDSYYAGNIESNISYRLYPNDSDVTTNLKETLKVPFLPVEEVEALVANSKSMWSPDDSWINDPPSDTEFQDNSFMVNKITEHCKIKGFKLDYCRLRKQVAYFSDGSFNNTPDCIHVNKEGEKDHSYRIYQHRKTKHMFLAKPDMDKVESAATVHDESASTYSFDKDLYQERNYRNLNYPCLYLGPTWTIYFTFVGDDGTVVDGLQGNEIHVVTGKMWKEAIYPYRPDLVEEWNPPDDELYYVASHWCSRNGSHNYHNGIDLYSLYQQRLTLFQWISTFFTSRCISYNIQLPFVDSNNIVNGYSKAVKLNKITSYLAKVNNLGSADPIPEPEVDSEWNTDDDYDDDYDDEDEDSWNYSDDDDDDDYDDQGDEDGDELTLSPLPFFTSK